MVRLPKWALKTPLEETGKKPPDVSSILPPPVAPARTSYLGAAPRMRARSATTTVVKQPSTGDQVDPRFDASIQEALGTAQSRGFAELLNQIKVLERAIPDENARIATAVESVSAMLNLTRDQLVAAIQERLSILDREKEEFTQGIEVEMEEAIAANNEAMRSLDSRRSEIEQHLRQLQEEKDRAERDYEAAKREVADVREKEQTVRAQFEATWRSHKSRLDKLLNQVQSVS